MTTGNSWYVIYTRPRWEKKVAALLTEKGIENYCPLNRVMRQWSDRKKVVSEPLFKGYVFVRLADSVKWDIKKVDGVINFIHWLGKPAKVRDEDILTIRKFLQEFSDVSVSERVEVDREVVVKQGVMMNYRGIVLEVTGNRAKVLIDSMGLFLTAFFDKKNLEAVNITI